MSEETSKTANLVMAVVSLGFGLFIVFVGPFILQITYEAVLNVVLTAGSVPGQQFFYTPFTVPMFFYFYRAIGVMGGIFCILLSYSLWKGKSWAWPLTLLAIALPTIFSVLSLIPYMAHVMPLIGGMPPSLVIVLVGMVVYWIVLLFPRSDKMEKAARLCAFTFLGLLAGEAAVFCMQGAKVLGGVAHLSFGSNNPAPVLNSLITIFGFSWPLQIFTVIMCVAAIYLLAKRDPRGWWLGLIAGVTGMVANFPTQIVRMITVDFLITGILALLVVVSLMIPAFKKRLIEERE